MSERQKPTPGPWRVIIDDDGNSLSGRPSIVAPDDLDCDIVHWDGFIQEYWRSARGDKEIHANARLIAAAGTAAHACEQLGYDGTRAIEALPGLLEAVAALHVEEAAYIGDADFPNYAQTTLSMPAGRFRRVLAALAAAKPEGAA